MFQPRWRAVLSTFVLVVCAWLTSSGPAAAAMSDADDAVQRLSIAEYAKRYEVSTETAKVRLAAQARGYDLVGVLDKELGSHFGGVWFDNEEGRFKVAVTTAASAEHKLAVTAVLKDRAIAGQADILEVKSGYQDLVEAAQSLPRRFEAELRDRQVVPSLNVAANAVQIGIPENPTAAVREKVEALRSTLTVDVITRVLPKSDFVVAPAAGCTFPYCPTPIRGGVEINGPRTCTAGYAAFNPANRNDRYVITAGHCNPTNGNWTSFNTAGSGATWTMGTAAGQFVNAWGDGASIPLAGNTWGGTVLQPWLVVWNANLTLNTPNYTLNDRAWSFEGLWGCRIGRTTGIMCGVVLTGGLFTGSWFAGAPWNTTVGTLTVTNSCALGGDSGGPYTAYNVAYGVVSASTGPVNNFCANNGTDRMLYSEALVLEGILGLRIVTQATGPA